jgi:hypothetical protein
MEKAILPNAPGEHTYLILSHDNELYLRCGSKGRNYYLIAQRFMKEAGLENNIDDHIIGRGLLSVVAQANTILFSGDKQKELVTSILKNSGYQLLFYGVTQASPSQ